MLKRSSKWDNIKSKYIGEYSFKILLSVVCMLSLACSYKYKVLDLKAFKITIPKQWNYKKLNGIDSFVGEISTGSSLLRFDYSTMGYASFGPVSKEEYLIGQTPIGPIEIQNDIKKYNIQIDTTDKFICKTVWPKRMGKGMTGIFIRSRTDKMSFNLVGNNFSPKDEEEVKKAFKTLIIQNRSLQ